MNVTFVVGPTASGKSDWALDQAEKDGGVIINCDSVQIYDLVQIGAAKPTASDLKRCPHFLFGYVRPPQETTAGEHRRQVLQCLSSLEKQGQDQVYIVGGTGFYFQALERGMFDAEPAATNTDFRAQLEAQAATREGLQELYEKLLFVDPDLQFKIHANDRYRIIRALEIYKTTGQRPSVLAQKKREERSPSVFPYPIRKIGITWPRDVLVERIRRRTRRMLDEGLIEETMGWLKMGLSEWPPLKSVGYNEVQLFLNGQIKTLEALEEAIVISTRQLAKRQVTWFKRDPEIQWWPLKEKFK